MIKVIHGEIYSSDFSILDKLVKDFSSCVRYSFCRFQKDKLKFNDVRNLSKLMYPSLNTRQVSDAVMIASGIYNRMGSNKVIFGRAKEFKRRKNKVISHEEYIANRDKSIYSRGDRTKTGNPNIRIVGNKLRITVGKRQFIEYNLFIPNKFKKILNDILISGRAYNVRLIKKDTTYKVLIDFKIADPEVIIDFSNGAIGVDTNPDRIALAFISKDGNLEKSFSLINNRLYFSSTEKRLYDIGCLVKEIVSLAKKENKGIVFEDLQFNKNFKDEGRKFNRTKSNFVWKKFITLLERKCIENGIKYKKVNPAFTSVIGKNKYKNLYNINTHESAAFVIGRRGLGFNEKLSLYGYSSSIVKTEIVRTLEGKYDKKRIHNWIMWKIIKSNYKALLTAVQARMSNLKEFDDSACYAGENPASKIFESELITRSVAQNTTIPLGWFNGFWEQDDERHPSMLINFG